MLLIATLRVAADSRLTAGDVSDRLPNPNPAACPPGGGHGQSTGQHQGSGQHPKPGDQPAGPPARLGRARPNVPRIAPGLVNLGFGRRPPTGIGDGGLLLRGPLAPAEPRNGVGGGGRFLGGPLALPEPLDDVSGLSLGGQRVVVVAVGLPHLG
jgi:hypothetical protein